MSVFPTMVKQFRDTTYNDIIIVILLKITAVIMKTNKTKKR